MSAYYNEHDPKAAAWLRMLVRENIIAAGEVDERSIEDVTPNDLRGFTQCHFFAGIGGWSEALRMAGWADDRHVWTGSCPCQPFSAAGQGKATADERHLWPAWFHLIEQCRPAIIFGEQVDAAIKHGWLDLVQADVEGLGYAFAPVVIPAAGVGAPHGRHRIFYVADSRRIPAGRSARSAEAQSRRPFGESTGPGDASSLEHSNVSSEYGRTPSGQQSIRDERGQESGAAVESEGEQERISRFARERRKTNGFWLDADWIPCRDGSWRPIEPGVFPLAHGVPARMDLLRGFGNAIVPQAAAKFIEAYEAIQ
jgi:DNA (cytosine-5)-methyltransferase 1